MQIYTLTRRWFNKDSTVSTIEDPEGRHLAYAVEDPVREPAGGPPSADQGVVDAWVRSWKVKGATAIPYGRYRLAYTASPRLKRYTIRLLDVPGFDGILIHPGNTAADSMGCILLGISTDRAKVAGSRDAVAKLEKILVPLIQSGEEIYLDIVKGEPLP
jgi:hypothetical protein